ncbi:YueI family protein [Bacillaceae bacterium IKA-2]|nr:YueI family protein [Bacillaceae bacterium IKA-2]
MPSKKIHELLMQGIHGATETLPQERVLFLSTIRERVYLALTNKQVFHKGIYNEALQLLQSKKDIHLFINGELSYQHYSNYLKAATKYNVPFTVVNDGHDTPLGLVLASDKALTNSDDYKIFIEDEIFQRDIKGAI